MTVKPPPGLVGYLLVGQVLIPAVINAVVNLGFGLAALRGRAAIATWGVTDSAVADSLATCALLPLITCLIATPIVRRQRKNGTAPRVPVGSSIAVLKFVRGPLPVRCCVWGLIGLLALAGPVIAVYALVGAAAIPATIFVAAKVCGAVILGAVVTPIIAFVALTD